MKTRKMFEGFSCSWKMGFAVLLLCVSATAIAAEGQVFTKIATFDGTNGNNPITPLAQGTDGSLYGTTSGDGSMPFTVFKITRRDTLVTLHSCDWTDCVDPDAGLFLATDGNLYGTSGGGGTYGRGTVYKITPTGTLTTLYSFCAQTNCTDGRDPEAGLVEGIDGNFYGTTIYGGDTNCIGWGCGTVFKITPGGTLTTLHRFCIHEGCLDGQHPSELIQATDGSLYGATSWGAGPTAVARSSRSPQEVC